MKPGHCSPRFRMTPCGAASGPIPLVADDQPKDMQSFEQVWIVFGHFERVRLMNRKAFGDGPVFQDGPVFD